MTRRASLDVCPSAAPACDPDAFGGAIVTLRDSGTRDSGSYWATRERRSLPSGSAHFDAGWCSRCGRPVTLSLMADAKTVGGVYWEPRKGAVATVPNSFALPAGPLEIGGSCTGATSECEGCYAAVLESAYGGLRRMLERNFQAVRHVLDCDGFTGLGVMLGALVRYSANLQRADGIARPVFRWHADGDIFSADYARAIAFAARASSDVEQWIYTRSLAYVRYLVGIPNLRVLVSVDRVNVRRAAVVASRYALPVAILADNIAQRDQIWARVQAVDVERRIPAPVVCPASGKWQNDGHGPAHIVGPDGRRSSLVQGGQAVGACLGCGRVCLPSGRGSSVVFLRHGSARQALASVAAVRVSIRGNS
jgi:hypothetical protein